MEATTEILDTSPVAKSSPIQAFYQRLRESEPEYARLSELRRKGWDNPDGDVHFESRQKRADSATKQDALRLYRMMQEIGDEMQVGTEAFLATRRHEDGIKILDLCMAPGGYTASALKYNPTATAFGITLPPNKGGHKVLLKSHRCTVLHRDITLFAKEFGVEEVPRTHPDRGAFSLERPIMNQKFDLVICDGQVLRDHKLADYRKYNEATRLTLSQLILALQRIREGGTLVMLLHKIESMPTMQLLHLFSRFSKLQVFKPARKHGIKSTFYLIAKNVQPDSENARLAVITWKKAWHHATFAGEEGVGAPRLEIGEEREQIIIDSFGEALAMLARPIWSIQADALSRLKFIKES